MKKKFNALTSEEERVILHKGTEKPFQGEYNEHAQEGVYLCKRCNAPLYRSEHKFQSQCGWPSFDDEIEGAIKKEMDEHGRRTEIVCAQCDGHLGHIFEGEQLTPKNTRHCVNSISMRFMTQVEYEKQFSHFKKAYFAGGCFWGVEHLMQQQEGVLTVVSGYMGGHTENPTYEQVCKKETGHVEAVEVLYDPEEVAFEALSKYFFEIHDPTQADGQGPDIGSQYISVVFYSTDSEKLITHALINQLESMGLKIATKVLPAQKFWPAENVHQDYYKKNGKEPYCHHRQKRFD